MATKKLRQLFCHYSQLIGNDIPRESAVLEIHKISLSLLLFRKIRKSHLFVAPERSVGRIMPHMRTDDLCASVELGPQMI